MKRIVAATLVLFFITACDSQEVTKQKVIFEDAMSSFRSGDDDDAIEKSTSLINDGSDPFLVGQAYYLRGYIKEKRDSAFAAYTDYVHALKNYEQADNDIYQSKILNELGQLFYHFSSHQLALQYFDDAYNKATITNEEKLIANSLYGRGQALKQLGKLDEALDVMYEVLNLESKLERLDYFIDVKLEMADIHHRATSYNFAIENNWSAINSAYNTESEDYIKAKAFNNLADIYLDQKLFSEAKPFLDSSLHYNALSGTEIAVLYNNAGRYYHGTGNDFVAASFFKKSLDNNHLQTDLDEISETKHNLEQMFKSGMSQDSIIMYYQAMTSISVPDYIVKQRIEFAENKQRLEAKEASMMISALNSEKNLLALIAAGLLTAMLISTFFFLRNYSKRKTHSIYNSPKVIKMYESEKLIEQELNSL